ncbi:ribbon-helix-helix domain-containing protein [Clostridium botulinum]|uniref:ribbon-helix-helix domain-containing protein n=1 Tax=unclassified Clostridium TaxID=2614128 RepID=UPI0013C6F74A|nr:MULTISPECIES: ribbon-helix-helix domain-containing protein [unclassified Clostridium]MBY7008513.1 ribbon-helix-helix domain-containing protein [Clostridium botulinum]NFH74568.1 ribbon-helix-helix domain-containing protein [Clostridium botulinum]NFI01346.1 ribbon-helix-helix domain-containing protein [Clostridium botulinum]NFI63884.1 ribbon-helix-helix domain-containing protein [Clostridium botulinum]NFJ44649.1 ribbon-helix-helix domain-containing protein [Clostridium botulinum]
MARKSINTTVDETLMKKLKLLSDAKGCKINELIEEGIKLVIENNKDELENYIKELKGILDTI